MSRKTTSLQLPGTSPGTRRAINAHHYGQEGGRPKAYVQAGLHADEVPPFLVARHLMDRLDQLQAEGAIKGEIVVVPVANPIGLDQVVHERTLGRFALAGGGNFNRHYPDLVEPAAARLEGALAADARANVWAVRRALMESLTQRRPIGELETLRHLLLGLALDADIVLDLHCDDEAAPHVYLGTALWPAAEDLTRQLGAKAVLLAETSGGEPFDEACSSPWWRLAARFGAEHPIPPACLAATIELRGNSDVDDLVAAADATAIIRFFKRRGLIAGEPGSLPPAQCQATPLDGVDMVRAPVAGVVVYRAGLGDQVRAGDTVAELVDPETGRRSPLTAQTDGPVWARSQARWARPGDVVMKVAGAEPLAGKGPFLLTNR